MGSHVVAAVNAASDMELVAKIDVDDDVAAQLRTSGADVAVYFTVPAATEGNVQALISAGIHAVVGTTGWDHESLARVEKALAGTSVGVLIAPNFSLSAVLAMKIGRASCRE